MSTLPNPFPPGGRVTDSRVNQENTLSSMRDTARALSISERTLFTLVNRGHVKAVRIGGRVLFDPSDVRDFIERAKTSKIEL